MTWAARRPMITRADKGKGDASMKCGYRISGYRIEGAFHHPGCQAHVILKPTTFLLAPILQQNCHLDRKWSGNRTSWQRRPSPCHPERSRGICGSADQSWKSKQLRTKKYPEYEGGRETGEA